MSNVTTIGADMNHDIPAVRILPMSSSLAGFRDRTIEDVQRNLFLRELPKRRGAFLYRSSGLVADPGTIVLFQFRARIIALATFLRDEPFDRPRKDGCSGEMHFDPRSIRTFDPIDVEGMRKVWPSFRAFGHVKQRLNPTLFAKFKRSLKNVAGA